ncbi:MAG: thiol:disulfide interchange protein, partial [Sulfurospirillum sp.]|nr:thiol:disulfide interchange protein [Sulfurospirillum sp.]
MKHILRGFSLLFVLTLSLIANPPKILTPEEAFTISALQSEQGVTIKIGLGEGIYLYDDKIKLELVKPKQLSLEEYVSRPKPEHYQDYITQRQPFEMFIPQSLLDKEVQKGSFTIKFSYQGCSELGICYQPMSNDFTFTLGNSVKSASLGTEQDQIAYTLANSNIAIVLATFFGFGLLLALTPCVFPMIPILSSIIVSQPNATMNAKRGFLLSLVYVLAMSLAYAIAGVLAGLFGANLQASMQNPWVITV